MVWPYNSCLLIFIENIIVLWILKCQTSIFWRYFYDHSALKCAMGIMHIKRYSGKPYWSSMRSTLFPSSLHLDLSLTVLAIFGKNEKYKFISQRLDMLFHTKHLVQLAYRNPIQITVIYREVLQYVLSRSESYWQYPFGFSRSRIAPLFMVNSVSDCSNSVVFMEMLCTGPSVAVGSVQGSVQYNVLQTLCNPGSHAAHFWTWSSNWWTCRKACWI